MTIKETAHKAKESLRKTFNPTNADRYEQAKKLKAKNDIRLERIRSMEAVKEQRERAIKFREREERARYGSRPQWMQDRPSSQKVANAYKWGSNIGSSDPFAAFNSPLFAAGPSGSGKKKGKKQQDFPDFNFL